MNRRSSPGLGQWLTVSLMVVFIIFLFWKLYQFTQFQMFMPAGLTIAGVDVGGLTREEAGDLLTERYLRAPVTVFHRDTAIQIDPVDAEFQLDLSTMLSEADFERSQQDFWSGFWGFLWGRPVAVNMVELRATHNRDALRDVLELIASSLDQSPQPPQPVPAAMSFQYGAPGMRTDIEASLPDVENALYRAINREATLVVDEIEAERPDIQLLARLMVNHLQEFSGIASVFIMDLETGQEISYQANVAMSGMDMLKLPITLEAYTVLESPLTISQTSLIDNTLVQPGNTAANQLLTVIAGRNDLFAGVDMVTADMQRLGLVDTFIVAPYEQAPRATLRTRETPANQNNELYANPDPVMQTTAEDMGTLLAMLYYCARDGGGALRAMYGEALTQAECQEIIETMQRNQIGSLIEEGVPPDVRIAHRHGWINDTHGDAAIVYSPNGDYVVVIFMFKPDWLEWELSSPLIAQLSRAAYNFFNFDQPYLDG
ncbi:MAG: hypothetical protein Fur0021_03350 [Candidatus Promineifilaceae bacterium]